MSAEIIAFPAPRAVTPSPALSRSATPGGFGPSLAGDERLRRALAALDAAVTGQRAAVAEWRRSLAELSTTMNGLGASLGRYRDSLTKLETQVGAVNGQAVTLEAWADKTLAAERG